MIRDLYLVLQFPSPAHPSETAGGGHDPTEQGSERLLVEARFGDAVGAALAAVRSDPLRESAHAMLIRIHLAEGNQSEALTAFANYSALLRDELDLEPTPLLRALVRHLGEA